MNLIDNASAQYQQQLKAQQSPDPLANLAAQVDLKVNSPEAEQKLRIMGQAIAQQAAESSILQQVNNIDKATTAYKQSFFQGKV